MASGDTRRAKFHRVVEERLELDFGVTQYVRIGCASGGILAQEIGKHAILVFGGEVDGFKVDADDIGGSGGVDEIPIDC